MFILVFDLRLNISLGRTIRKVMGGSKNKNRAGETERRKKSCTKNV
jgi:hypothetical protein